MTIDTLAPTITSVYTALKSGNYSAGDYIDIIIAFSKPVTFSELPDIYSDVSAPCSAPKPIPSPWLSHFTHSHASMPPREGQPTEADKIFPPDVNCCTLTRTRTFRALTAVCACARARTLICVQAYLNAQASSTLLYGVPYIELNSQATARAHKTAHADPHASTRRRVFHIDEALSYPLPLPLHFPHLSNPFLTAVFHVILAPREGFPYLMRQTRIA